MRIELDTIVRTGEIVLAAVVKHSVHHSRAFGMLAVYGTKLPVAILIRHHERMAALEIDGTPIDLCDFDRRYPRLRATFEGLARSGGKEA